MQKSKTVSRCEVAMNYHNILYDDMLNGPGLRVVLFVSGCNHHCHNCHNPETHDPNSGVLFDEAEVHELERELSKDYIQGLTLSGGDPLFPLNIETILDLCWRLKQKYTSKDIWLYTGYKWEEIPAVIRSQLKGKVDVVVDGKFDQSLADVNAPYVGSINQRIIDVAASIENGTVQLKKIWSN